MQRCDRVLKYLLNNCCAIRKKSKMKSIERSGNPLILILEVACRLF